MEITNLSLIFVENICAMVEQAELEFWEWASKVAEKLLFLRLKVQDHKDITEDDHALLKALFPVWYNGEYMLCQAKIEGERQSVTQINLFSANSADTTAINDNGKKIDYTVSEPKITEQ